jgi:hypothetical protein
MFTGIIQKPTSRSYFTTTRAISALGFGDIIMRDRLELIFKFSHFAISETSVIFEGPKKTLQNFPSNFTFE